MSPAALLDALRDRRVIITARGDRLRVEAPPGVLTPDLKAELVAHKAELLALLRGTTPVTRGYAVTEPGAPLRAGVPGFDEVVTRLLDMPLDRFAESGQLLEVHVAWWPEPLWFVPTADAAGALEADGVSRGRIWTAGELTDLLSVPGITPDQARTVALAKLAVAGEVAEVRPHGRTCPACHGRRWWRSTSGRVRCATCHPPASPGLVADWLDGPEAV